MHHVSRTKGSFPYTWSLHWPSLFFSKGGRGRPSALPASIKDEVLGPAGGSRDLVLSVGSSFKEVMI